ncbi:MAG: response regulator [Caldilineaceae bacterium]|nr:response regulator [Caldilineaceae bacterium]
MKMVVVLLLEDNPASRKGTTRALEMQGFAVNQAQDANNLIEILQSGTHRPNVIVAALHAFTEDSLAHLDRTRRGIPVLFLSSRSAHLPSHLSNTPLAADVIVKPFLVGDLIQAVDRMLSSD